MNLPATRELLRSINPAWHYHALFSPDGFRLIVATTGESLRVWDAEGGLQVLTLSVPGARFASFAFSPDGNLLGARNVFGQLHLGRAPSWADIDAAEGAGPVRQRIGRSLKPSPQRN